MIQLASSTRSMPRWHVVEASYRSNLEFGDAALAESAVAFQRVENFVRRAHEATGGSTIGKVPVTFAAAMDDDLNVPAALAVLHESVTAGNSLLAQSGDVAEVLAQVRAMLDVIGVDPLAATWSASTGDSDGLRDALDALVAQQIEQRAAAKAGKDYATADRIRDDLRALGIVLQDGADGVRWSMGD